jgi:hypothetical protein
MFALNIPSTFGDTIDCRINGKPKRVSPANAAVRLEAKVQACSVVKTGVIPRRAVENCPRGSI